MLAHRGFKATTINRRLEAVRRLLRWAEASGAVVANVARDVRTVRPSIISSARSPGRTMDTRSA